MTILRKELHFHRAELTYWIRPMDIGLRDVCWTRGLVQGGSKSLCDSKDAQVRKTLGFRSLPHMFAPGRTLTFYVRFGGDSARRRRRGGPNQLSMIHWRGSALSAIRLALVLPTPSFSHLQEMQQCADVGTIEIHLKTSAKFATATFLHLVCVLLSLQETFLVYI